jgi:hypothetical protein
MSVPKKESFAFVRFSRLCHMSTTLAVFHEPMSWLKVVAE